MVFEALLPKGAEKNCLTHLSRSHEKSVRNGTDNDETQDSPDDCGEFPSGTSFPLDPPAAAVIG